MSAEHCRVSVHADKGNVIEDRGSINGTFVNGRRIEGKVDLTHGDRISLGSKIVRFYIEEIPDRPTR